MSSAKGGPAFPSSVQNEGSQTVKGFDGEDIEPRSTSHYQGMTLRDYFAAKAMQGFLSGPMNRAKFEGSVDVAELSYLMADAMLQERAK